MHREAGIMLVDWAGYPDAVIPDSNAAIRKMVNLGVSGTTKFPEEPMEKYRPYTFFRFGYGYQYVSALLSETEVAKINLLAKYKRVLKR